MREGPTLPESLAGRIETVPLEGFRLADLGAKAQPRHWLRGGFPRAFTARSGADSFPGERRYPSDQRVQGVPLGELVGAE
jgi:hypothetical protein